MVSWPYVCRHITECSYPPPPLPRCELALFRRANFVLSRTILHQSPQPLVPISQHLAFWHRLHLAASRTDLCHSISCRSCSISCYILAPCLAPITAASRTNLAAFGTDLAASGAIGANLARSHVQTFHHLDRSRGTICTDLVAAPSCSISTAKSPSKPRLS